jgi:hypothetical protein
MGWLSGSAVLAPPHLMVATPCLRDRTTFRTSSESTTTLDRPEFAFAPTPWSPNRSPPWLGDFSSPVSRSAQRHPMPAPHRTVSARLDEGRLWVIWTKGGDRDEKSKNVGSFQGTLALDDI